MEQKVDPVDILLQEHRIISDTQKIISALDNYWIQNEATYTEAIRSLLEFFRNYSDGYHHFKEEKVFFPYLENRDDLALGAMISELKDHHEQFREYTKGIEEALNEGEYTRSYSLLSKYLEDLLNHIAAEDDEFFVAAQSLLSDQELETLYYRFKDIDLDLGETRKEALVKSLVALEQHLLG